MHQEAFERLRRTAWFVALAAFVAIDALGQELLSLEDAIARALERNASLAAAEAAAEASEAGIDEARAALLPRIDFTESFRRSDNPVFVFGTLLNQGRFTEENFALDPLNHPAPLSLYQSQFRLRQLIFDRKVFLSRDRAELNAEITRQAHRQAEMETIFATARLYHGVQVAGRNTVVLRQVLDAARADLSRAGALHEAGQVTEADVLSLRVHVADLTEQIIRADNDVELMRSELNRIIGEPLEKAFELTTSFEEVEESTSAADAVDPVGTALENSPVARQHELQEEMAGIGHEIAKTAFLPSFRFDAAWESDRVSFTGDGGTNWMLGVAVDVNLFDGLGKLAGLRVADAERRRASASLRDAIETLQLEVRRASLDRKAALESVEVARQSVAQARESHRITEARYEGGLANVTELLRSQNALLGAEARHLGAIYQVRLSAVRLALVTGTLDRDSEVLQP